MKSEPPLHELLGLFEFQAAQLGITPKSVWSMRGGVAAVSEPLAIDHTAILAELMESQSCATAQEALCLICEKAMGRLSAAECLAELDRFLAFDQVVHLGRSELLTQVFTSKATLELEATISRRVAEGAASHRHRLATHGIDKVFDALERELAEKLGVPVSLAQQREAALHVGARTGATAFVEGWAGTGKTTMLRALGQAYKDSGFAVLGCCQSAAASQNLARETGIPSRTIASLLLSLREGRAKLSGKSVVVLDEAGMVGSSEFAALQEEAAKAGAKLVCVGDPKQLQPIGAGGIFASLMREHGKAEISAIQRQRTDFEPLLGWLESRAQRRDGGLTMEQARALRQVPEEARMQAMEAVCSKDAKLARAFARWRSRFDHEWMREVVERFAKGDAEEALLALDARGRLKFVSGVDEAMAALVDAWEQDRTALPSKAIVAGTRGEVSRLNDLARSRLVAAGAVRDALGAEIEIVDRDENRETKRFAPGDRVVFTQNERPLGVVNGAVGTVKAISREGFELRLAVELDDENERGERSVDIPASFARFDLAYCLTNHKAQGRTFDAAYVLANPAMSDREWTYVAASRSRFATTMFVNASALGLVDAESHRAAGPRKRRADAVDALAKRMRRTRAKGTTLDHAPPPKEASEADDAFAIAKRAALALLRRVRERTEAREARR